MRILRKFYIVFFLGLCLIPLAALPIAPPQVNTENQTLSSFPSLREGDGWNISYLSELGNYFQDHFAFRSVLVSSYARLLDLFGTSGDDGVIRGTEGWLYYANSLNDYQGIGLLSDREIFNISHSMALAGRYLRSRNASLLVVPVPNKSSLYGEHMPYYDRYRTDLPSNLQRLYGSLLEEGVPYVNLYAFFQQEKEKGEKGLFHPKDSHWTNIGACMAANQILEALGRKGRDAASSYLVREDFEGDLEAMLHPWHPDLMEEAYYEDPFAYEYVTPVSSNFEPKIETTGENAPGSLVMYRDSFCNALLPFLSEAFGKAYYSRVIPYPLTDVEEHGADTVIFERAERFLPDTAANPPVVPGRKVRGLTGERLLDAYVATREEGLSQYNQYLKIAGYLEEDLDKEKIYLRLDGGPIYEALPATLLEGEVRHAAGYILYLPIGEMPQSISVEVLVGEEVQQAPPATVTAPATVPDTSPATAPATVPAG